MNLKTELPPPDSDNSLLSEFGDTVLDSPYDSDTYGSDSFDLDHRVFNPAPVEDNVDLLPEDPVYDADETATGKTTDNGSVNMMETPDRSSHEAGDDTNRSGHIINSRATDPEARPAIARSIRRPVSRTDVDPHNNKVLFDRTIGNTALGEGNNNQESTLEPGHRKEAAENDLPRQSGSSDKPEPSSEDTALPAPYGAGAASANQPPRPEAPSPDTKAGNSDDGQPPIDDPPTPSKEFDGNPDREGEKHDRRQSDKEARVWGKRKLPGRHATDESWPGMGDTRGYGQRLPAHHTSESIVIIGETEYQERSIDMAAESLEAGDPIARLTIDLDHFKDVNGRWGYRYGTEVLNRFVDLLGRHVRSFYQAYGDILIIPDDLFTTGKHRFPEEYIREVIWPLEMQPARLHGDEFAIACRGANRQGGSIIAERIRAEFREMVLKPGNEKMAAVGLDVSIGVGAVGIDMLSKICLNHGLAVPDTNDEAFFIQAVGTSVAGEQNTNLRNAVAQELLLAIEYEAELDLWRAKVEHLDVRLSGEDLAEAFAAYQVWRRLGISPRDFSKLEIIFRMRGLLPPLEDTDK